MGMFDRNDRYKTVVNRGDTNMEDLEDALNKAYEDGWRLHTIFEQAGNTCIVYEKRDA